MSGQALRQGSREREESEKRERKSGGEKEIENKCLGGHCLEPSASCWLKLPVGGVVEVKRRVFLSLCVCMCFRVCVCWGVMGGSKDLNLAPASIAQK